MEERYGIAMASDGDVMAMSKRLSRLAQDPVDPSRSRNNIDACRWSRREPSLPFVALSSPLIASQPFLLQNKTISALCLAQNGQTPVTAYCNYVQQGKLFMKYFLDPTRR
jgi:hypothetical protein